MKIAIGERCSNEKPQRRVVKKFTAWQIASLEFEVCRPSNARTAIATDHESQSTTAGLLCRASFLRF